MRSICLATLSWVVLMMVPPVATATAPLLVDVEQGDGSVSSGRLERIDGDGVRLVDVAGVEGGILSLPAERVRAVRRTAGGIDDETTNSHPLVLTMIDGSTLSGTDVAWDGSQPALVIRPEGQIELPAGRIRSIAWRPAGTAAAATPAWQEAIPEGTESDLVVVGSDASYEFVECAITGVSADTVTVVLEEETIPVKRSKVLGLQWLREDTSAAAGAAGEPHALQRGLRARGTKPHLVAGRAEGHESLREFERPRGDVGEVRPVDNLPDDRIHHPLVRVAE